MLHVIAFNLIQLLISGYSLARGGAPERITGASLLAAMILTRVLLSRYAVRFVGVEWGVFTVDVVLLTVLLAVALFADRFWPLWVVALHALGTTAHLLRLLDGEVIRFAYAVLTAMWAYPIMVLLAAGTARHQRRLRFAGRDPDWSSGTS